MKTPCFPILLFCLPFWLFQRSADTIESLVGPLTEAQHDWLEAHAVTSLALTEIAEKYSWSELEQAEAIFDHFTTEADPILTASEMAGELAILKILHPDWSLARVVFNAAWNVTKGQTHNLLDLAGLVPGLGEGADFVNGVFYCLEGDKANAAFSFTAMVPFLGWTSTGAKYAGKIVKTVTGKVTELKYIVDASGLITFGRRSQLAAVLGKKVNHQVHHIIPWSKNFHEVVQKAADSGSWHPNLATNGMQLDLSVHNGFLTKKEHDIYNFRIEEQLNQILQNAGGNISPKKAVAELEDLANDIRRQ